MDTSETRPENEVPEPPMPIADQVSNDDRQEGNAEDEEKKEVNLQAAHWGGRVGVDLGEGVDHPGDPSSTVGQLKKGLGREADQDRPRENSLV